MIAFLRAQVDRGNDGSFLFSLYDFCYFDKKIFKKSKNLPKNRDRI